MKCSSRPTASSSSRQVGLALVGLFAALCHPVAAGESVRSDQVEQAIAEAVRARMGEVASVDVTLGHVRLTDNAGLELEARPAPGARLGRRTRFTLYQPAAEGGVAQRVGYAVAEAHATIVHLRTARPIARGTVLEVDDLVQAEGDVGSVLLKPLPTLAQVLGSTAARTLTEGDLISAATIRPPTLVRSGDVVVTRVRVGSVVVTGRTTATRSGQLGDVVGLVNEESGRRLRGRVIAAGEVEVVR